MKTKNKQSLRLWVACIIAVISSCGLITSAAFFAGIHSGVTWHYELASALILLQWVVVFIPFLNSIDTTDLLD